MCLEKKNYQTTSGQLRKRTNLDDLQNIHMLAVLCSIETRIFLWTLQQRNGHRRYIPLSGALADFCYNGSYFVWIGEIKTLPYHLEEHSQH